MQRKKLLASVLLLAVLLLGSSGGLAGADAPTPAAAAAATGTGFTYQGQLIKDGVPANGSCDFRFTLFDAASGGVQVGPVVPKPAVAVTGGLFTVPALDFGSGIFTGQKRWLQVEVSCPASGSPAYTVVGALQELTATPYALFATGNWGLTGNTGAAAPANFLGTLDNQALELRVWNARALRIEPAGTNAANLIGGYPSNEVTAGAYGAAIEGGGYRFSPNRVTDNFGSVGGGAANVAGDDTGATNDAEFATVSGGYANHASGVSAAVAGGSSNAASGGYAAVGGGSGNAATADYAASPGGRSNAAAGPYSFAAGRRAKANHPGSFVWGDSTDADVASTANDEFRVRASGGVYLAAGTGAWRVEPQPSSPNLIAGSSSNVVSAGSYGATIAGGGVNAQTCGNGADPCWNRINGSGGTVGGGEGNATTGMYATVNGGASNTAYHWGSIGGGARNAALQIYATIAGGDRNSAGGEAAMIPGGRWNIANGDFSFAAGLRAKANDAGSFVWADGIGVDFPSWGENTFRARATGGFQFITNAAATSGSTLAAGSYAWTTSSDRNLKENFEPVDGRALLDRLAGVPVSTWNYKTQDPAIRHIGPMAQDFYAAFGLGEDDKHISTLDPDGVALAASQELYVLVQEQAAQLALLRAENVALKGEVAGQRQANAEQDARLDALEAKAGSSVSLPAALPVAGRVGFLGLTAGGLLVAAMVIRRGGPQ